MGELADSFGTLLDSDMWTDIGILLGSFLAGASPAGRVAEVVREV